MDILKSPSGRKKPDLALDDISAINGQPKVPLADLERAAARADALGVGPAADRAQLDVARPGLLLASTGEQLAEHDATASAFSRQGEGAAALAGALRERAEVERVKRYDAAAALAAAVPAAVEAEYRDLGGSVVPSSSASPSPAHPSWPSMRTCQRAGSHGPTSRASAFCRVNRNASR